MYITSASDVHPHHFLIVSPSTPSRLAFVVFLSPIECDLKWSRISHTQKNSEKTDENLQLACKVF